KHRLASSVRGRRPASSLPRVKHRDALSSGLGLLRVSDWKMALIMRLGLEMKEGLLLWWLSRGMTENLFRWNSVLTDKDLFFFSIGWGKEGSVIKQKTKDEFCREIELLARLHHRHLVALKGFCAKKNK
ncbi:hypothetical protein IGI04_023101, partial [Brassica rapa subsp. trilocularis]